MAPRKLDPSRMTLEGSRVLLRPLRDSDAASIYMHARDPEVLRYTLLPSPYRPSDSRRYVRMARSKKWQGKCIVRAIVPKPGKALAGVINLDLFLANRQCYVGYWLAREYWGRGLAKESLQLMLQLAFQTLGLSKVTSSVMHKNVRSYKLLEGAGFRLEGRQRRQILRNGEWYDELLYGLLKEEWVPMNVL
jgi:RimJ/RimL family protein N-acetyltransferase